MASTTRCTGHKDMARIDFLSEELARSVEAQHGGSATPIQSVPVRETFGGETVWEGVFHVFDLADNPHSTRAYAWS